MPACACAVGHQQAAHLVVLSDGHERSVGFANSKRNQPNGSLRGEWDKGRGHPRGTVATSAGAPQPAPANCARKRSAAPLFNHRDPGGVQLLPPPPTGRRRGSVPTFPCPQRGLSARWRPPRAPVGVRAKPLKIHRGAARTLAARPGRPASAPYPLGESFTTQMRLPQPAARANCAIAGRPMRTAPRWGRRGPVVRQTDRLCPTHPGPRAVRPGLWPRSRFCSGGFP